MSHSIPQHPLGEVFGFPPDNQSARAVRYRQHRLCPFNNRVANCTKDKANDPLGVCSVLDRDGHLAVTCPVRFRQDWLITDDAAQFFFSPGATWTTLNEVRLDDRHGRSAGNIDLVLVAYNQRGQVVDFGALEVQAVYISGNIRRPFEAYMQDPLHQADMDWSGARNYPRPDYLSSSRKRLVPQLIYKGGILKAWGKKQAVVLHHSFFNTLPELTTVPPETADMVWLVYDLEPGEEQYQLRLHQVVHTRFSPALDRIITPEPGPVDQFVTVLQEKLDAKLEHPPDAPTLADLL
ncbi:MAG: hypothetical protein GYB65_07280 [Chloroflexi bacterium]|nr:hypothetical protein [Chloroflexota bacterium]